MRRGFSGLEGRTEGQVWPCMGLGAERRRWHGSEDQGAARQQGEERGDHFLGEVMGFGD